MFFWQSQNNWKSQKHWLYKVLAYVLCKRSCLLLNLLTRIKRSTYYQTHPHIKCEEKDSFRCNDTKRISFNDPKNIHTPFDRLIFQKNFEIEKNASKVALAAVLLQQDADNYLHPISYHSRMLNKH